AIWSRVQPLTGRAWSSVLLVATATTAMRSEGGKAPGPAGARGVVQAFEPLGDEAFAPLADGMTVAAQFGGDLPVGGVSADGRLVTAIQEFLDLHRGWFAQTTWSLDVRPVGVRETADLAVAVLHLEYRDQAPDGGRVHETSYLTLVFAREGDRWVMVQDQNT